ncbi:bifunctional 5,10-methylene-tetrahydrofolate dehydrogenase/5,10-methylene-tetrahydrofolate cyclohydrolase [bacterium]|nr:bifunctional 5,10-methylene-tetrahydrofolate dehydrogenase/5,10-methylene-tetrahydrofolate cyclohydrolase [bacterium]
MATILSGKELSARITENLTDEIKNFNKKPSLAVILVGNDPASELYVGMKQKKSAKLGINSSIIKFDENTDEKTLLAKIQELNLDNSVDAILVQLPLPKQINKKKVFETILPTKDVDGFTPENVGRLTLGLSPYAIACTPKGILTMLNNYNIKIDGKNVVIIGRSDIVGKPMAQLMLNENATVTVCHSHTKNLPQLTKNADILISAVGKPKMVTKDMIKENAVVIDVGVSKIDGKIVGDVDFEAVSAVASYITPCVGGVGPMTIASLMQNTFELFKLHSN